MKRILLPTDFSKNSWNAILTAVKLYAWMECKFYLLNAYEPSTQNITGFKSSTRAGDVYKSLPEASEKELGKVKQYLDENHFNPKHSFETISLSGDLLDAIHQCISSYDLDTLVMGTKGSTGAKQIFMGSWTVKVLKNIKNCTIIAVPSSFDFQRLNSVVFPTEYTHFMPRYVLMPLLELTQDWKPEIKIFHVAQEFMLSQEQKSNMKILQKRFRDHPTTVNQVVIKTTVAEAIRNFAEEQRADLIVLTNYSHDFFEKLTQEPVVKKVTFRTKVPLMVLPDFG
ncbi:universal stress protein [Muricauda sp. JGD-17]|uniref:Universal stress protein n=1 Tax=Flagellimonas ochracea TaxID=2696472 RepID=A0A964TCP7_9FLAO|nr:universal stress protein [Allomuricauda ochracea]NAY92417.1 universal stress protein [Allomuricauda ochracea]